LPHISSPEAYVDEENQQIRLYYHGLDSTSNEQFTRVASSEEGISFTDKPEKIGNPYFRVFRWKDWHFALAQDTTTENQSDRGVTIFRSDDGLSNFERGQTILNQGVRHVGLRVHQNRLEIYFTRIGDKPEQILRSDVQLLDEWRDWSPTEPIPVLSPSTEYEGIDRSSRPSAPGSPPGKVNQVRDPEIFTDNTGGVYLFYSIAGESGIAVAKILDE